LKLTLMHPSTLFLIPELIYGNVFFYYFVS
jgi:hypothetical protein